jgi:DNA-binding MarR family transcriptional regulator
MWLEHEPRSEIERRRVTVAAVRMAGSVLAARALVSRRRSGHDQRRETYAHHLL